MSSGGCHLSVTAVMPCATVVSVARSPSEVSSREPVALKMKTEAMARAIPMRRASCSALASSEAVPSVSRMRKHRLSFAESGMG